MFVDSNRSYQKGAISIFGILALVMLIPMTMLTLDTARFWMVKRELQAIADISAIEASKGIACNASVADIYARADSAASRNGYKESLLSAPNVIELGSVTTVSGQHQFLADGSAQAVHIKATKKIPVSLVARGIFGDDILLTADAVSLTSSPVAAFSAGTGLLALNTTDSSLLNSLLGDMLGTNINLDLVSYQGLADTTLTLGDLINAHSGILNAEELLTYQFSSNELLTLVSNALLSNTSNVASSVINDTVYLAQSAVSSDSISLNAIINLNQFTQEDALNAELNLLNLITSISSVSNGSNGITLPVSLNLPGLTSVDALVNVIEPAQIAIGPPAGNESNICTVSKTAQVSVSVPVFVNLLATIDLSLNVQVAAGAVGLRNIEGNNSSTDITFESTSSAIVISLTNNDQTGPASISLLGIPLAHLKLNLAPELQSTTATTSTMQIERPVQTSLPQATMINNSLEDTFEHLLSEPAALEVTIVGLDLTGVVSPVVNTIVKPLLLAISQSLLDPLLKVLGISINNIDVTVTDVTLTNPNPLVI